MIKSVTNYSKSDFSTLPEDGWIKPCFYCETITSSYIIVKRKYLINDLKYYFCPKCIKNGKYSILGKEKHLESNLYGKLNDL